MYDFSKRDCDLLFARVSGIDAFSVVNQKSFKRSRCLGDS